MCSKNELYYYYSIDVFRNWCFYLAASVTITKWICKAKFSSAPFTALLNTIIGCSLMLRQGIDSYRLDSYGCALRWFYWIL